MFSTVSNASHILTIFCILQMRIWSTQTWSPGNIQGDFGNIRHGAGSFLRLGSPHCILDYLGSIVSSDTWLQLPRNADPGRQQWWQQYFGFCQSHSKAFHSWLRSWPSLGWCGIWDVGSEPGIGEFPLSQIYEKCIIWKHYVNFNILHQNKLLITFLVKKVPLHTEYLVTVSTELEWNLETLMPGPCCPWPLQTLLLCVLTLKISCFTFLTQR